jgi:hypothetical protein
MLGTIEFQLLLATYAGLDVALLVDVSCESIQFSPVADRVRVVLALSAVQNRIEERAVDTSRGDMESLCLKALGKIQQGRIRVPVQLGSMRLCTS